MSNELNSKMIALAVMFAVASVANPAMAEERWHGRGHDREHDGKERGWYDEGRHGDGFIGGFVVGPPVVYVRPPVVYAAPLPPPIYYVPPAPVYAAPPVILVQPSPSLSIGVSIPLH
jgi:hypothetical protein